MENLQEFITQLETMSLNNPQPDDEDRNCFLDEHKEKAREIGKEIEKRGGLNAMQYALQTMNVKYSYDKRELECAWDGIGNWRF